MQHFTSIEICAGAGGQALGLELAGFEHLACIENDRDAVATLHTNRPNWNPIWADIRDWSWNSKLSVSLLAGGVPCPPYSIAGQQLGSSDERDLFPEVLRLVREIRPRAVMIENVRGLLSKKFTDYRAHILDVLSDLGYLGEWKLLQAVDFGVPQLRPRSVLVALQVEEQPYFVWPSPTVTEPVSVGVTLKESMAESGWEGAHEWSARADGIAPTLVGGSKKHGGADLGPTRAKQQWALLGVDGKGIADSPPEPSFRGMPRLTIEQTKLIQGFPSSWKISGKKTAAYRQIGNAFPPPVAEAVGRAIREAFVLSDAASRIAV